MQSLGLRYDPPLVEHTLNEPSPGPAETPPDCPRCGAGMVLRTARKGANQGNQFWGCPTFPKCRGVVPIGGPEAAVSGANDRSGPAAKNSDDLPEAAETDADAQQVAPDTNGDRDVNERRRLRDKLATAAIGTVKTVDKIRRSVLESEEPDASGRWSPEHRRKLLRYVYERDGRRCGVCGAETRIDAAHVEHIVPKIFAYFDISKAGKAVQGTRYKSLLHKLDNLQASHTYCNKNKGNTADVTRWRHATMPSLAVALAEDGAEFRVPPQPVQGH